MPITETQLVLEAVGGSSQSFGELTERYCGPILGLVYSYVGEMESARDLTQEVFSKAFLSLSSLHRPESFGSWLRQIAVNFARSHVRKQARDRTVSLGQVPEEAESAVDAHFERVLIKQEVLKCLELLPEASRSAIVMHYLVGLAPADAARHLGISRAAFDTRLSRGREMLRMAMLQFMDEALADEKEHVASYLSALSAGVRATLGEGGRKRVTAVKELALLAARANLPRLAMDLTSPNDSTRKKAAQLLGQTADRRAAPVLIQALGEEEEPSVLAALCRSLGEVGATEAVEKLQELARNTANMEVNKAASEALKLLQARAAEDEEHGDIPVTMADLREAGIEAMFLDMLSDRLPAVRVHAIDGLGRVESLKAVPDLVNCLSSSAEGFVRLAAAEALGAILGEGRTDTRRVSSALRAKVIGALADAMGDPDLSVVAEIARAITAIGCGGEEILRQSVMERFFAVIEDLVLKQGPWWVTIPAMLGALSTEGDLTRLVQLMLREDIPYSCKRPLGNAVQLMAAPGQLAANGLLLEAARKGIIPKAMVVALGKTLDESVVPFLSECVEFGLPMQILRDPKYTLAEQGSKIRMAAAVALARYPNGLSLLERIWKTWRARGVEGEGPLLALVSGLERAGAPAVIFEEIAGMEGASARVQISARTAAKRLSIQSA